MATTTAKARVRRGAKARKPDVWKLRLFVAGETPKSVRALANLKALCEARLEAARLQVEKISLNKSGAVEGVAPADFS